MPETQLLSSSADDIRRAAELLRGGKLVAFPTETVYGLGAVTFNEGTVRALFAAKGRPSDNPLIVHCASLADLERVAVNVPARFYALFEQFCPGPLTMLLERRTDVPDIVTAGLNTVAVRFPAHPVAQELIRCVGAPLVAPSANRSGYPSPTQAQHVLHDLAGRIEAVIDGGTCEVGVESTVLNILPQTPVLLRPGAVTKTMMETVIGGSITEARSPKNDDTPASPGMKYRHYAPDARVRLVDSLAEARHIKQRNARTWILAPALSHETEEELLLAAHSLYASLRRADAEGVTEILVVCDEIVQQDAVLMNRLSKAASAESNK